MPRVLIILSLFLLSTPSFSQEERILDKNPRSLGMGGVGVSTFGYSFSPAANPAALGLMFDYTIVPILEIGLSMDPQAISFGRAIAKTASEGTGDNPWDTDLSGLDPYIGKVVGAGLTSPLNIGFMGKGFGIWLTAGAEARLGVFNPPDSVLFGIKLNTLLNTVSQVSNLIVNSSGNISGEAVAVEKILTDGILADLQNSGLSDAERYTQANDLLNKLTGTTGIDYVDSSGNVNAGNLNNLVDNANNIKIDTSALLEILPRVYARLYADIAVNIGYGYKIAFRALDDKSGLSLGATLRFIQRFKSDTLDGTVTIDEAANNISLLQGFAVTSDFGLSLQLQNFVLGFAVRDAFSTPFQWSAFMVSGSGNGSRTSSFAPSYDLGVSYRFLFSNPWIQEIGLYVEGIDMASTLLSPIEKFRAGSELKLFRFLDLRVGVYDGFVTAGLGMGGKWGRVDFAYYRESFKIFKGFNIYGNRLSLSLALLYENTPVRKARAAERKALREEQKINAQAAAQDALEEASRREL